MNYNDEKQRNSSIELLKIVAILFIVQNHVVQTLCEPNPYFLDQSYVVNLAEVTTSVTKLLLSMIRSCGSLGNLIFFICSAWFLVDSTHSSKKKALQMIADVWVVSVLILVLVLLLRHGDIELKLIIHQFFPITFNTNWYVTCYLLFYLIHPLLNLLIRNLSRRIFFRVVVFSSFIYLFINYFIGQHYYSSTLIVWVVIYFLISYLKTYRLDIIDNFGFNLRILLFGILGNATMFFINNIIGLHFSFFSHTLLHWTSTCSPFIICCALGLFNLVRKQSFICRTINYFSKLSLFIYIIHENMLIRLYYRPYLWIFAYNKGWYENLLCTYLLITCAVLLFGVVGAIIYNHSIHRMVQFFICSVYSKIQRLYMKIEDSVLRNN